MIDKLKDALGDKIKEIASRLLDGIEEEVLQVATNKILEYEVEEYQRNSCSKTLLHRAEPKRLKEFYQPLFISKSSKEGYSRVRRKTDRISTESVEDLFSKDQLITLIGDAGSGKSTMVKYLFLNSIERKFKIPIKIELRYLNNSELSLIEYIKENIFKFQKLADSDRIIERLLSSGSFLIFLDGYDEVKKSRKENVTKDIDNLIKVYNKNSYLLTTRPYTDIDLLPLFHNYTVCDLNDDEINEFIKKQIPESEEELCQKIIEAVNNPQNNSYKSFLKNPLLLSMFILTFQSYSSIPEKRSEFYRQVFDALFALHDSMSKMAFVREKQSGLSKDQFIEVLKLFSFISYFDEKFAFNHHYLTEKLSLIKEKKKSFTYENEKILNDLKVAIGIINQDGLDYTFPHRSLQEYFAALYISTLSNENKALIYNKIEKSFAWKDNHFMASLSKDNFYQLLSELDDKGVIEYILIPYLEKFEDLKGIEKIEESEVLDIFVNIRSVFESFNTILKSDDFTMKDREIGKEFQKQRKKYVKLNDENKSKDIDPTDLARSEITESIVRPYLKECFPMLKEFKQNLVNYLKEESQSDNDIISMI